VSIIGCNASIGAAFTDAHFASWEKADTSFFGGGDGGLANTVQPRQGQNFIGEIVSKKMHTQGDVLTGWYGGVGTDYMLTRLVSVGVEYRHVDWGSDRPVHGGNGPIFSGNGHLDLNADQVVFKVNLLVGPFGH
jgi:opacity protein-like surface antigen